MFKKFDIIKVWQRMNQQIYAILLSAFENFRITLLCRVKCVPSRRVAPLALSRWLMTNLYARNVLCQDVARITRGINLFVGVKVMLVILWFLIFVFFDRSDIRKEDISHSHWHQTPVTEHDHAQPRIPCAGDPTPPSLQIIHFQYFLFMIIIARHNNDKRKK